MGVFSGTEIKKKAEKDELITRESFRESSVRPASYDVTIAMDGLRPPDSEDIPPDETQLSARGRFNRARDIVLHSGDTAVFSSRERFHMPHDAAGNITVKNRLANEGLTLLSGMLIDPGYGLPAPAEQAPGGSGAPGPQERLRGSRIFLHVANIGKEHIVLRAGEDTIVRVQFLPVIGPPHTAGGSYRREWGEQRLASLGFLTELKELKEKVERSEASNRVVVMLGIVVVMVALIAAAFSSILSIVTNTDLRKQLQHVWPASGDQAELWVLIFIAVLLFALSCAVFGEKLIRGWLEGRKRRRERARSSNKTPF